MYDKPERTIDIFGRNMYAYITSLHNDNLFNFAQLLVLGYTMIKTGSIADRICIVSNDIADEYIEILQLFFQIVRMVDHKINNNSYLKYYALNFTNYKKIIIINPNFVILQNPDFLFTLRTPAAYFESDQYISTELLVLEPIIDDFDSMLFDLSHSMISLTESEYIFNRFHSRHWNKINGDYFYNRSNIININNVRYIYYQVSPVNIVLADLHKDDIYLIWYDSYKSLLSSYPNLITKPLLNGPNRVLTQIMRNFMSRPEANIETDIINIKNVYQTNEIHINLQKYYHILKDIEPRMEFGSDPDLIDDYDYMQPIKKLNEIYKSEYLNNLKKYTTSDSIPLHSYGYMDITDREQIFLIYLKSKKYINYIVLDGDMNNDNNKLKVDELRLNGIYYIKTLNLTKKMYENLFFFIKDDMTYDNRIKELDLISFVEKQVTFVFYKDVHENYRSIRLGELIFNQNNTELLKTQDIRGLSSPFMNKNLLYIHTLRNWLYSNMSQIEIERFVFFGDVVLGTNGIKLINKIEGVFVSIGNDSSEYEKNLEELISDNLCKKSGFHFTRITKENSPDFKKYHERIFNRIKEQSESVDLVFNPSNYYNFYGLKILKMDLNILHMELQKEIDLKTDIVMTNIINKPFISRLISYDADKRIIRTNKKFKLSDIDIKNIRNNARNKYIKNYINMLI